MNTSVKTKINRSEFNNRTISDLYKELEKIREENYLFDSDENELQDTFNKEKLSNGINEDVEYQIPVLQGCLKVVYVVSQLLGLYPITGFFEKDVMKIRFSFFTWNSLYSLIICSFQFISVLICFYRLILNFHLSTVVYAFYYTSTCMTCILSLIVALRWPGLILKLTQSRLDEYTDSRVKQKCTILSISFLAICIGLQLLRTFEKLNEIMNCNKTAKDMLITFTVITNPWIFELNMPYNLFTLILLFVLNIITSMLWYFSDIFIVCISLFLTSILRKINEKIISSEDKILPSNYWRHLREDYNRVTTLIRSFDDVMNSLIFSSFANSLFFICLQLYYIPSPFNGIEYSSYILSLITFLILKFILLTLSIAEINSASLTTVPSLYKIRSSIFCKEVQRFIDQLHGQIVALSGLKCFLVTRELIFSMFSTIITYAFMLFQFNGDSFREF